MPLAQWGVRMRKVIFVLIVLFSFGPPFLFGFIGSGLLAALGWSAGMALFAVGTGWRAGERGIPESVMFGMCYATAVIVPFYFFGKWLGNPELRSVQFTLSVFVLGLLLFASLVLLRRLWPLPAVGHDTPSFDATRVTAEIEDVFKKFHRLMENEQAQTEKLAEPLRSKVRLGADCDQIPGGEGEFGRDPRNPVPVNGPLGAVIYLSNLRTVDSQPIMFHRLGSVSNVEVYETVSLDGALWDILFLDQFHPRKSIHPPFGYRAVTGPERNKSLFGTNEFLRGFPDRLSDAIAAMSERLFGFRMRPPQVREALKRTIFERPSEHLSRIKITMGILQREKSN
jgi:hypothetical protein